MPTRNRSQTQRAALKKLKGAGLYSGKLPRGKLTDYQQKLVRRFDDVVKGRAAVVQPKNPKDYSAAFDVKGKHVIVPKGKGEKIKVNKSGNVTRERKGPRGEKITGTFKRRKPGEIPPAPPPQRRVQYAIPFARKLGKNRYRLEWKRFPTYDTLAAFMREYEPERYPDWPNFVFEEEISEASLADRNRALNEAAVKYGRADSLNEFEQEPEAPIMKLARRNRREARRAAHRRQQEREG